MAIELHNLMEVPAVDLHGSMAGLGHGSVNTSVTGCVGVDTPMTGHGHGGVDTSMSTHLLTKSSWREGTTCLPWAPGKLVSTDLLAKSPWQAGTDHLTNTARKSGLDGCIQVFIGCGHPIQTQARATK
ncbi:hypothetical protein PCANC_21505 [Puccinia coronata f. sp. avenae]|uniref:Uncharacterized protein n=1 Tax=Puccinia coronata f. sp. avenae TaxID=200324 RepID=A0A2N5S6Y6_9BASI|nr:hypothetical protein PCANC_21505 [Puccinia coronata f. sp. avenae]